ncbi:MAG: phage holin family protein [Candidatus Woesebacteria bacterium]
MRGIVRQWLLYILALYLLDSFFGWVTISDRNILLVTGTAFFLLNTIGKPILKILWLPINIITLGLFSWVMSIAVVVLVILFVPGFHISAAEFSSVQIGQFVIPEIHLKMFWTYFLFSFLLAWSVDLLGWIFTER